MPSNIKNFKKTFQQPDERRDFKNHGHLDVLKFEDGSSIGRAVFEKGWRWSNDVKPIAGTDSCEASHTGYCLSGQMTVRMNSGEEIHIKKGEAFRIPPGHDAWIEGSETCELLDFTGFAEYAQQQEPVERKERKDKVA